MVDTSAIVAILRGEPDAQRYRDALSQSQQSLMSTSTYLEVAIVVDANRDPVLSGRLDDLLHVWGTEIVAVTPSSPDAPTATSGREVVIPPG